MDSETLALIDRALAEDVGGGDVTTDATVRVDAAARATIVQKAPGVISGLAVAEAVFARLDRDAVFERLGPEGEWRERSLAIRREHVGPARGRAPVDGGEPVCPTRHHGSARTRIFITESLP